MTDRADHLAWCKRRALEYLDRGDRVGAVSSMISDLGKADEPLYDQLTLRTLVVDGMQFASKTDEGTRHWIEGFK